MPFSSATGSVFVVTLVLPAFRYSNLSSDSEKKSHASRPTSVSKPYSDSRVSIYLGSIIYSHLFRIFLI